MENKDLKEFESVFIVKGSYNEEEYQKAFNKVKGYMENLVEIENIEEKGLRKLAYTVRKENTGYYVIVEFKAMNENIVELERFYRIDDDILKFITVRKDI